MINAKSLFDDPSMDLASILVRLIARMGGEVILSPLDMEFDHSGGVLNIRNLPDGSIALTYFPPNIGLLLS